MPTWVFAGLKLASTLNNWQPCNIADSSARVQIALNKQIIKYQEKEVTNFLLENGSSSAWVTVGINGHNNDEMPRLERIFNEVQKNGDVLKVVIDASNGHMKAMTNRVSEVRQILEDRGVVLAGNIVTGEMTEKLIEAGADGVKLNHGASNVCRTRQFTGTYRPTFSAALDCSQAAKKVGGFVVSDGGVDVSGTAAVLFASGVRGVMSGNLFAGHEECGTDFNVNLNPFDPNVRLFQKFMWYQGNASIYALKETHGGKAAYRPVEGTRRKIAYKGQKLSKTLEQYFGGIASAVSFQSDFESGEHESGTPIWRFNHLTRAVEKGRLVYNL